MPFTTQWFYEFHINHWSIQWKFGSLWWMNWTFVRNLDEGNVWSFRDGKKLRSLLKKCLRWFVLILLLMYVSCFVTIEQSQGCKDLASEKLEVCELFCMKKKLYFVAHSLAKFHNKSGRIFIIAHFPFTWKCNNITAILKRLLHITMW